MSSDKRGIAFVDLNKNQNWVVGQVIPMLSNLTTPNPIATVNGIWVVSKTDLDVLKDLTRGFLLIGSLDAQKELSHSSDEWRWENIRDYVNKIQAVQFQIQEAWNVYRDEKPSARKHLVPLSFWPMPSAEIPEDFETQAKVLGVTVGLANTPEETRRAMHAIRVIQYYVGAWLATETERVARRYLPPEDANFRLWPS